MSRFIVVIGAGPSGLAAARHLRKAGHRVQVLEADDKIGGRIQNVRVEGCIIDTGASLIPARYDEFMGLCRELGIADRLATAGSVVGFPRAGKIHYLDSASMMIDGARSSLFSLRSKLALARLALDAAKIFPRLRFDSIEAAGDFDTETATAYAMRKLNAELEEFFVGTTVRGMFGHRPDQASVIDFFWGVRNFLGGRLYGLLGGMSCFTTALAEGTDIRLKSRVLSVAPADDGVRVDYVDEFGKAHHLAADACVCATDANTAAAIIPGLPGDVRDYLKDEVEYTACVSVNFVLNKRPLNPAFVLQIAKSEDPDLTTFVYEHNKVADRAPADRGLLCALYGHEYSIANLHAADDLIIEQTLRTVRKFVPEIDQTIIATHINRWPQVVVKSRPGTYRGVAPLIRYRERGSPIQLAGDYFSLSGMNSAIVSGRLAAERLG